MHVGIARCVRTARVRPHFSTSSLPIAEPSGTVNNRESRPPPQPPGALSSFFLPHRERAQPEPARRDEAPQGVRLPGMKSADQVLIVIAAVIFTGFGAWFLSRPGVRRGLCRQAFADPDANVGAAEEQIASLHLQCPGWAEALAAFARSGGFSGCGIPLPDQPLHVIWGDNDRILRAPQKKAAALILNDWIEQFEDCGHLPHIDQPDRVAERCLNWFQSTLLTSHPSDLIG